MHGGKDSDDAAIRGGLASNIYCGIPAKLKKSFIVAQSPDSKVIPTNRVLQFFMKEERHLRIMFL